MQEYGNERKDLKRNYEFSVMLESTDRTLIDSSESEFQGR